MSVCFLGTGSLTSNGYFDSDSIIVEVLLNADPAVAPGSYQLDVTTYFDTSKAVSETKIISSITTTSDISAISTVNNIHFILRFISKEATVAFFDCNRSPMARIPLIGIMKICS